MSIRYRCSVDGVECYLVPLLPGNPEYSRLLAGSVRGVAGFGVCPGFPAPIRALLNPFMGYIQALSCRPELLKPVDADVVVGHHENVDSIATTLKLAEHLGARSVVILHNPPFYGDPSRVRARLEAFMRAIELVSMIPDPATRVAYTSMYAYTLAVDRLDPGRGLVERMLGRVDLILSVSPSTPVEMGGVWVDRVKPLKPGVGVDPGLLAKLRGLRAGRRPGGYGVYASRFNVLKGCYEVILAWRLATRMAGVKPPLVLLGPERRAVRVLLKLAKVLDVKAVYPGYLRGDEYWWVRANATVTVHPSHEDAYSLTVLESLLLGVPVVAYDIPALRLNYQGASGLHLVREGDVEALAQRVAELLEKPETVEKEPPFKTWDEIAVEELGLLESVATIYDVSSR
jgi:glycosyltransferase involved in cell wall biosynthesis